jgi:hypothetical protein
MRISALGTIPALVLFMGTSPAPAATWLVAPDGSSNPSTIQAAVVAASPGDTVALADGIFTGNGNRDVSFLGKAIVLRSVSGHPESCVVDAGGSQDDNHRCFYIHGGEGVGTVIEGITLRHGYIELSQGGGGILCEGSSPTIRNCIFTANYAAYGAGLGLGMAAHPTVSGCLFTGNECNQDGAGIGQSGSATAWVTATNCRFESNVAGFHAGAAAFNGLSQFTDCVFVGNRAASGGAFFFCGIARSEFVRCTFVRNSSQYGGAGIT